jgi:DnaJ-like protein
VRRSEALAELELHTDATPVDIKTAYRDLVKIWHPDRFVTDDRLRQRAQQRLQRINEAYRTLESGEGDPEPDAAAPPAPPHLRTRAHHEAVLRGWLYLALFVLTVSFLGYATIRYRQASHAEPDAPSLPAVQAPEPAAPPPDYAANPTHLSAPQSQLPTRITPLNAAQMQRINSACGDFSPQSQQYANCIQANLSAATPHSHVSQPSLPQLDGLTADEKISVQHVCATAPDYTQCAAAQVANLAAAPHRPDISRLNPRDRAAVERACSSTRDHDGPAAYDHCIVEFEQMLASHPN